MSALPIRAVVIALLAVALAGCLGGTAPHATLPSGGARPTVVALIDSGINPYHAVFQAPCFHLPPEEVHCIENTGPGVMRSAKGRK